MPPPAAAPATRARAKPLRLIVLLLAWTTAGATLNVAVAWGLHATLPKRLAFLVGFSGETAPPEWMLNVNRRIGSLVINAEAWRPTHERFNFQLPGWSHTHTPPGETGHYLVEAAFGWPMLALLSRQHDAGVGQHPPSPSQPLWPGFAINTLFYAGVLWVLFAGPFALRRMIRRRRGQCAQCAYPIGQNERCTECGAGVTPRFISSSA